MPEIRRFPGDANGLVDLDRQLTRALRQVPLPLPARQLLFVYLANDIMQNSRRKGPEFVHT